MRESVKIIFKKNFATAIIIKILKQNHLSKQQQKQQNSQLWIRDRKVTTATSVFQFYLNHYLFNQCILCFIGLRIPYTSTSQITVPWGLDILGFYTILHTESLCFKASYSISFNLATISLAILLRHTLHDHVLHEVTVIRIYM